MTAPHSLVWLSQPPPALQPTAKVVTRAALSSCKAASRRSAAAGTRAWMTGRVSIQEAQLAAWRSVSAARRPSPPNRSASRAARAGWGGSGVSARPKSVERQLLTAVSCEEAYAAVVAGGKERKR